MRFNKLDKDAKKEDFKFTAENLVKAKEIIKKYPDGCQRSAVMPLLDLAQRQNENWLPRNAMDYIADMLNMPKIKVYEIANFYTMYNKKPVGENLLQVCRTTPCWLNGAEKITSICKKELGIEIGQTTEDGKFTLKEVECLGACVNAPVMQINDDYYENLTEEQIPNLLSQLKSKKR